MTLDTRDCNTLADLLAGLRHNLVFTSPSLQSRHTQIQNQLQSMEAFFRNLGTMAENTDRSLQRRITPVSSLPGVHFTGRTSGSLTGLSRGRALKAYGSANCTLGACSWSGSTSMASGSLSLAFFELSVSGSASFYAFSKGRFSPRLVLGANASARLASGSIGGRLGNETVALSASAAGEAGALYAGGSLVLSLDEQVLQAQAGAAAVRGECSFAIETLWGTITVTASGSIGSIEAGFGWHSREGQWVIEANGALLAGAGLRVQVDY